MIRGGCYSYDGGKDPVAIFLSRLARGDPGLAAATAPEAVLALRDRVEAVRRYLKARRAGIPELNAAQRAKLRCERKAGVILAAMEKNVGGRPGRNPSHRARGFR